MNYTTMADINRPFNPMSVVSVPVTKFSRKILLREHGLEPVRVKRSHPLWVYLRPHAPGDHAGGAHIAAERCAHINIEVSYALRQLLRQNLNDAGLSLHRHHVEWMLRFTWANTLNGVPALRALKSFYLLYGLDDDDYDLGSAFRMWQRFKQWIEENFDKKSVNISKVDVLSFCRPGEDYANPLSDDDLDTLANDICQRVEDEMQLPDYVFTQLAIWVHVRKGSRRVDEVARKFGKSERRTYMAVQRINDLRKTNALFFELTTIKQHEPIEENA